MKFALCTFFLWTEYRIPTGYSSRLRIDIWHNYRVILCCHITLRLITLFAITSRLLIITLLKFKSPKLIASCLHFSYFRILSKCLFIKLRVIYILFLFIVCIMLFSLFTELFSSFCISCFLYSQYELYI